MTITREEFIEEWVAALRSGNYKQGKSYLNRYNDKTHTNEYCCLGVACELGTKYDLVKKDYDTKKLIYSYDSETQYLPSSLINFLGISLIGNDNDTSISLIFLNDSNNDSFNDIADVIESSI